MSPHPPPQPSPDDPSPDKSEISDSERRGRAVAARSAVCGIVLAAGEGQRLRPLTADLPKALCPVGNIPLLDRALARLAGAGVADVAVNAAYLAAQVVRHVGGRAHLSVEE